MLRKLIPRFSANRRKMLIFMSAAFLPGGCGNVATDHAVLRHFHDQAPTARGVEVVIFSMSLLDTGYRFGGKNPDAGLDCSGMVSYVFRQAAGYKVEGNAAMIANQGQPVEMDQLRPGDLVFFDTRNRPFSHVGIYVGEERFIHAPNSKGRVRIDSMNSTYFRRRYHAARRYF